MHINSRIAVISHFKRLAFITILILKKHNNKIVKTIYKKEQQQNKNDNKIYFKSKIQILLIINQVKNN